MNYNQLSKEISYALRHAPEKYNLVLDSNGWVSLNGLIEALKKKECWKALSIQDIKLIIEKSDKKRFEINDQKIRAIYGHSIKKKIEKEATKPPKYLYHGTVKRFIDAIKVKGLIPKNRQYVHLSATKSIALEVGKRRDDEPILLRINAEEAYNDGIKFYLGHDEIWLSDEVSMKYIEVIK